ncbi:MAG: cyclic nucleotide-binding domain-containing protein [Myxococcales bacterium]|nr:cyclic nucleotide-binding domain-containing protein [Myxococcales bacterium]
MPRLGLRDVPFFAHLPKGLIEEISGDAEIKAFRAGDVLVREGDPSDSILVLLEGVADVKKREAERADVEHVISELEPGEVVGEVGLFDKRPRSATVVAREPCAAWILRYDRVTEHPRLVFAFAKALAQRVRHQTEEMRETAQERVAMGELVVKVIVLLCVYALLVAGLPWLQERLPSSSSYISLPIIALFGLGSFGFMRNSGYPLSRFGLGFKNLFGSLFEAILLTPPFLALLTGVKWLVVHSRQTRMTEVIQHPDVRQVLADPRVIKLLAVYGLSALVQELIVRCALQSTLESYLVGKGRVTKAILVAALMFSVNHLHVSFLFAVLAFLPGIFWGIMFHRRPNLIGPSLSHFVVGGYVFFVLGIG